MSVVDLAFASVCVLGPAQGDRGPFRGKLPAEYGAQVFTVDLPSADITRHRAPFADDQPDPEGSLADLHLKTAKRANVVISDHLAPVLACIPLVSRKGEGR